jgi:hypothetical protein
MGEAQLVGPDMPRILRPQPDARAIVQPEPAAFRLLLWHLQPLLAPDPLDTLAVHRPAGITQQGGHPAIAVATILLGERDDVVGEPLLVICPAWHLAMRRSMLPKHPAYPSLGDRQLTPQLINATPPPRGAQKFPRAASCKISLSSVRSEIARRSRAFSFSRSFIRRA